MEDKPYIQTARFVIRPEVMDLIHHLINQTADVYEVTLIMKTRDDDKGVPIGKYYRVIALDGTEYEIHSWKRAKRYYVPRSNNVYVRKPIKPEKVKEKIKEIAFKEEFPDWNIRHKEIVEDVKQVMKSLLKQ